MYAEGNILLFSSGGYLTQDCIIFGLRLKKCEVLLVGSSTWPQVIQKQFDLTFPDHRKYLCVCSRYPKSTTFLTEQQQYMHKKNLNIKYSFIVLFGLVVVVPWQKTVMRNSKNEKESAKMYYFIFSIKTKKNFCFWCSRTKQNSNNIICSKY